MVGYVDDRLIDTAGTLTTSVILVPLDGSDVAERAVPFAMAVAARADARLRLVHVHSPSEQPAPARPPAGAGPPATMAEAESYMGVLLTRVRAAAGDRVSSDVMRGDVREVLLHESRRRDVELVVMSTHGASGLRGALMGTIAQTLVHEATVPVLVCGPAVPGWGISRAEDVPLLDVEIANIAVALDGGPAAESILTPVSKLARMFGARLTLLAVAADGHTSAARAGMPEAELAAYLDRIAAKIGEGGIPAHRRLLRSEDIAGSLVRAATSEDADILAMTTHARGPALRIVLGSVSASVVAAARMPVLLYRPAVED